MAGGETRICVVDTDVIVDMLRGSEQAREQLRRAGEGRILATTAYNILELYRGAYLKARPEEIEKLNKFAETLVHLPLTSSSAKKAAGLIVALARQGIPLEHPDVIIAAITMEHGAVLLSGNKKHFRRITELELV